MPGTAGLWAIAGFKMGNGGNLNKYQFSLRAQQVVGAGKFFLFVLNVLQSGEVGMPNKLASVYIDTDIRDMAK